MAAVELSQSSINLLLDMEQVLHTITAAGGCLLCYRIINK